jgi:ferredoxin
MAYDFHETATATIDADRCNGCGCCAAVCSTRTLVMDSGRPSVGRLTAKYGIPKENKICLGLLMGHPVADFRQGIRRQWASVRNV